MQQDGAAEPTITQRVGAAKQENTGKEDALQSAVGEVVTNPIARMGVQYAMGQGAAIEDNIKQGVAKYLEALNLKYYFSIDEKYVFRKCKLVLCPIFYKGPWKRQTIKLKDGQEAYLPPKQDLNAPDLYIPTMAFLTYVLTAGFILGTRKQFQPEALGRIASTGFISLIFEVMLHQSSCCVELIVQSYRLCS